MLLHPVATMAAVPCSMIRSRCWGKGCAACFSSRSRRASPNSSALSLGTSDTTGPGNSSLVAFICAWPPRGPRFFPRTAFSPDPCRGSHRQSANPQTANAARQPQTGKHSLAESLCTWYNQTRREQCVARSDAFCNSRRTSGIEGLSGKSRKSAPATGSCIRGQAPRRV